MSKAVKLPSGNWRCRAYNKYTGKTKSFTASTKKEAEKKAQLYYLSSKLDTELTFNEALSIYIQDRSSVLSPNTIRLYKGYEKTYFNLIKNYDVSALTDAIVQKWVNELAVNHSPKTVKNVYGLLTAVIISQTPSKRFNVRLPRKVRVDVKLPSESEIRSLIANAEEPLKTVIELAVYCCMRRGEISALSEEDIHNGYISVRHSMAYDNGKWVRRVPKTYSSNRDIPCPDFLIEKLNKGLPNLNPSEISDRFITYKKTQGFNYRFHDLRHFSASLMLTVCPKVDVERMGGWQHGSNVLDAIYTYNIEESMKSSAQKWNDKIEQFRT